MFQTVDKSVASLLCMAILAATLGAAGCQAAFAAENGTPRMANAVKLRDQALKFNVAWAVVESLTTEVGSRPAGTAADRAAVAWAQAKLRELGFGNVRTQEVIVPQWVRGTPEFSVLTPFPQTMPSIALGGSAGTPDAGLTSEIVMAADVPALLAMPRNAVERKIVFLSTRMQRSRDGSGYRIAVKSRGEGPSAAAGLGAVGLVIRSIGTDPNRIPRTGTLS